MAQTGNFTPILLYASSTPGNVPLAARLTNSTDGSEIAINIADKNLFFKDSGGAVNTVPIRQSSASSNGWLSSTDWSTFNGKAPATTGASLLYGNGTGGFSNVTIGSGISFTGGTLSATGSGGTVTSVAALTIGTTGTDLSSTVATGTTTPVITLQVPTASATNRGALSSTDWSTFNSKQATLVSGTNIKTVGGVSLLGSGDVGTIGVGYGGTGTSTTFTLGSIIYVGASGVYNQDNANLFWDGTNYRLGLGTTTPVVKLHIKQANISAKGQLVLDSTDYAQWTFYNGATQYFQCYADTSGGNAGAFLGCTTAQNLSLTTNGVASVTLFSSAGVSIGSTSDPGAGNLRFNTTNGNGVYFGASSLLSDYEEGSWTPVFSASTAPTGVTYTARSGKYVKIGKKVTLWFEVNINSPGTGGSGDLKVESMPYTSANATPRGGMYFHYANGAANTKKFAGYIPANATYASGDSGGTGITWADIGNGTLYMGTMEYYTT